MKTAATLILAFLMAFTLGLAADDFVFNSYHHAQNTLGGKPPTPLAEWMFHKLAYWQNGAVCCVFLTPWALLLLETACSARRSPDVNRRAGFLFSLALFFLAEFLLVTWVALACIIPFYSRYLLLGPPSTPISAYIPHFILVVLLAFSFAFAVVALRRTLSHKSNHDA